MLRAACGAKAACRRPPAVGASSRAPNFGDRRMTRDDCPRRRSRRGRHSCRPPTHRHPGIDRLLLADRDAPRSTEVAEAFGSDAQADRFAPGDPIPAGVDVVVTPLPTGMDHSVVTAAIAAGVPVASSEEEHDALEQLRVLDPNARRARGVAMAVGLRLAPGLVDALARHAASMFDYGRRDQGRAYRLGRDRPASRRCATNGGCRSVRGTTATGEKIIRTATASCCSRSRSVRRECRTVTAERRCSSTRSPMSVASACSSANHRSEPGCVAVSATTVSGAPRGSRSGAGANGSFDCTVYGVVERTAVAAGAVLAVVGARLAGALEPRLDQPGVHGLGRARSIRCPSSPSCAQRGVRAAAFEGVAVA